MEQEMETSEVITYVLLQSLQSQSMSAALATRGMRMKH